MENTQQTADQIAESFYGIFNKTADQVSTTTEEDKGPSPYFNPDSSTAPEKRYSAKIKFLPNIFNQDKGFAEVQKYVIDNGSKKIHFKTPKSLGRYEDCEVASLYWKLNGKEQKDARLKNIGENNISWKKSTYALIQVIEDWSKPENNGKILVWNLPNDIMKLVEAERKPSQSQIRMGKTANNVFDPINGRCLMLDIPIKSIAGKDGKPSDVRDYTPCTFMPDTTNTVMIVNDETAQRTKPADGSPEMQQLMTDVIKTLTAESTLKLSNFDYKPESEETRQKAIDAINEMIALATGNAPAPQNAGTIQAPVQAEAPAPAPAPAPVQAAETVQAPAQAAATVDNATSQASNLLNQIFNDANNQ